MHFYDPNPGRPELVPILKALDIEQLSAYCSAVLSVHAGITLTPEPADPAETLELYAMRNRGFCVTCDRPLRINHRGRPRIFCSDQCAQLVHEYLAAA